jgi:hypothetical protein
MNLRGIYHERVCPIILSGWGVEKKVGGQYEKGISGTNQRRYV